MEDNKKKNTIVVTAIIIVIAVGAGLFYWYEWRPSDIRQHCYAEAEFNQVVLNQSDDILRGIFTDRYYEKCLKRFGIK